MFELRSVSRKHTAKGSSSEGIPHSGKRGQEEKQEWERLRKERHGRHRQMI